MKRYTKYGLGIFLFLALTGESCQDNKNSNGSSNDNGTVVTSKSPPTTDTQAFVVTTDFVTGSFAVIDLASRAAQKNVGQINSDAVATAFGDKIYAVNRFGADNIQLINESDFKTTGQFSTGSGTNPQDIALASASKGYIARLNSTALMIMNPATGQDLGSIDLTSHADADGKPEMNALVLHNGKLYVALARLDQNNFFSPTDHSEIVIVDTATDTVAKTLTTAALNPGTDFVYNSALDRILIGETGFFGVNDGGIESINPTTGTSEGLIVTEASLGGDIIAFDILSKDKGYAVVAVGTDCDNSTGTCKTTVTQLVSFNPNTGAKLATVFVGGPFTLVDVRFDSQGEAYLCDTTFTKPGIRVFDGTTDQQLTTDPIDTGLPPYKTVFFHP